MQLSLKVTRVCLFTSIFLVTSSCGKHSAVTAIQKVTDVAAIIGGSIAKIAADVPEFFQDVLGASMDLSMQSRASYLTQGLSTVWTTSSLGNFYWVGAQSPTYTTSEPPISTPQQYIMQMLNPDFTPGGQNDNFFGRMKNAILTGSIA